MTGAPRNPRRERRERWRTAAVAHPALAFVLTLAALSCAHREPLLGPGAVTVDPWRIPAAELSTQRLFRVRYDDGHGIVGLRLALRLGEADDYRVEVADALGRTVLSIAAADGELLMVDRRHSRFCRSTNGLELPAMPLGRLPAAALPRVLLGRLPLSAADGARRSGERLQFHDDAGRRWTAVLSGGRVTSWTLWHAGRAVAWWTGSEAGGVLSQREGRQLTWRQIVREALPAPPPPLVVPTGFRRASCDAFDLS